MNSTVVVADHPGLKRHVLLVDPGGKTIMYEPTLRLGHALHTDEYHQAGPYSYAL